MALDDPNDAYPLGDPPQPALRAPAPAAAPGLPLRWKRNLALFLLTVVSVFLAGTVWAGAIPKEDGLFGVLRTLPQGWSFAVPLLSILLVHEFGHYIAARVHHVEASLPYFIPLPVSLVMRFVFGSDPWAPSLWLG